MVDLLPEFRTETSEALSVIDVNRGREASFDDDVGKSDREGLADTVRRLRSTAADGAA